MDFDQKTVYIVGHAKTSSDNAITDQFKIFFISFIVDVKTDIILDLDCSATLKITKKFIKSIFRGTKLDSVYPEIEKEIPERYFGSSQKAVLVAYKDAVKKYSAVKKKYY